METGVEKKHLFALLTAGIGLCGGIWCENAHFLLARPCRLEPNSQTLELGSGAGDATFQKRRAFFSHAPVAAAIPRTDARHVFTAQPPNPLRTASKNALRHHEIKQVIGRASGVSGGCACGHLSRTSQTWNSQLHATATTRMLLSPVGVPVLASNAGKVPITEFRSKAVLHALYSFPDEECGTPENASILYYAFITQCGFSAPGSGLHTSISLSQEALRKEKQNAFFHHNHFVEQRKFS